MEVRCHGDGPHPAVRVHGRVHHRHAGRVCGTAVGAEHAVGRTPPLKASGPTEEEPSTERTPSEPGAHLFITHIFMCVMQFI